MFNLTKYRKDPIIVLGGMIVALTILVGAGFIFLYSKTELDVQQTSNEIGIIREMLSQKARLENSKKANVGAASDPVRFSTGNLDVTVRKTPSTGYPVTVQDLHGAGEECGYPQSDAHYRTLVQKLEMANVVRYDITSNKPSQEPTYTVYAVENTPGYADLSEVKKDLDVCAAGGVYPSAVSSKWILLTGSCGGAANADQPAPVCGQIQGVVEQTLKLVE